MVYKILFFLVVALSMVFHHLIKLKRFYSNPISPYGNSKLIIEKILIDLSKLKKINFYSLRYFNAAGADDDLEIGELHDPETHLIPLAIKSGFNKDYILKIFGGDFNTPDGTAIRDYIHVVRSCRSSLFIT